ncbi:MULTISPECIES: TRAP transporter small permease [unclassified Mesorhizobium]|uniref:TRAP transporter small permease n=1 Tax=unclassified Mesorhizobium TaxID=325217 RepID=UPI0009EC2E75|nr:MULTISPECIES: TRAP transporter small permease subunit [unclassified Mesorhizobium]MDR7033717.1 TRAP-type C4-dicarboxylate transport system permease small subunit [Mesorhizobium sp. BE184]
MSATLRLSRISDVANQICIAICALLLVAMMLVSTLGILLDLLRMTLRYVGMEAALQSGAFDWLYSNTRPSFVRLFLPWFGMLSITVAFKFGEHIAISVLANSMPRWALTTTRWINYISVGLFGLALLWYGYTFFLHATHIFVVSDTLQISNQWMAASVPITGLIICIHLLDGLALVEERNPMPFVEDEPAHDPPAANILEGVS